MEKKNIRKNQIFLREFIAHFITKKKKLKMNNILIDETN